MSLASNASQKEQPARGRVRDAANSPRTPWIMATLLVLFMVINYADRTVLALAAQPMMDDLDISAATFGLVSSAFFFLYSVSAVVVGFIADRFPMRWMLTILALLWMVTQLPIFLFASTGVLLFSRIALGAAEGPASPLANSTAYTWFSPEKRGLPASMLTSGASLAKIFVAPLITIIIAAWGWRYGFLAVGMASLLWAVAWFAIGREGPYAAPKAAESTAGPAEPLHDSPGRKGYWRAVKSKTFLLFLLATFPMYALITVIISWMPAYLQAGLGFSQVQAGFLYGTPSIASLIFMIVAGSATDRMLGRGISSRIARGVVPAVALAVGGLLIAALPLLANTNRFVTVGFLIVGYGLGNLSMPIIYAAIGTLAHPSNRSSVISTFIALQSISGIIAPWFTGILVGRGANKIDGYNDAFLLIGITIAVCATIAVIFVDPQRDEVTATSGRMKGSKP